MGDSLERQVNGKVVECRHKQLQSGLRTLTLNKTLSTQECGSDAGSNPVLATQKTQDGVSLPRKRWVLEIFLRSGGGTRATLIKLIPDGRR